MTVATSDLAVAGGRWWPDKIVPSSLDYARWWTRRRSSRNEGAFRMSGLQIRIWSEDKYPNIKNETFATATATSSLQLQRISLQLQQFRCNYTLDFAATAGNSLPIHANNHFGATARISLQLHALRCNCTHLAQTAAISL